MDKWLKHNGVDMFYTVEGEGPAVVLMHGYGCSHETVKSIEAACLPGHKVFNVDLPGHGKSSEPPIREDSVWGVEEYTNLIERLIEVEGMDRPVVIGHSFGGRIAILLASRNETGKVVLVDAAGVKPRRKLKYYLKVYSYKAMKQLYKLLYGAKAQSKIEAMAKKRGSADYRNSSPTMRRVMSKMVGEDLRRFMPSIKAPTLLIWGENDTATPLSDARQMEKRIPDAGLVAFPGCGHYSFLDNPYGFKAVLQKFLEN